MNRSDITSWYQVRRKSIDYYHEAFNIVNICHHLSNISIKFSISIQFILFHIGGQMAKLQEILQFKFNFKTYKVTS